MKILRLLIAAAVPLFWIFLLFGFGTPRDALLTVLAALIHEGGHFLALALLGRKCGKFRTRLAGFRLYAKGSLSYRETFLVAAAGPLSNLLCFLLLLPFPGTRTFALYHLFTALSNLLPARGYDGDRMLTSLLAPRIGEERTYFLTKHLRVGIAAVATVLSLYLALRIGEGAFPLGLFLVSLVCEVLDDRTNDFGGFERK